MRSYKRYTRRKRLLKQIAVVALVFILGFVLLRAVSYMAIQGEIPMINSFNLFRREADTSFGWNLILVNDDYCVPRNYEVELTELSNGEKVDSRIYPQLQQMFDDARAEGLELFVREGYRTTQDQKDIMNERIQQYQDEGYSRGEAKKLAKEYVAEPGTSEHELGIAVDINADTSNIYTIYQDNMKKIVEEYGTTPEKRSYLESVYKKIEIPFMFEAKDSWTTMTMYAQTYVLLMAVIIGFLVAGIFSGEFRPGTEDVFFATKYGRTKAIKNKIFAGILVSTVTYWIGVGVLSLISFAVMGTSGFFTPYQIDDPYSIYVMTYGEYYLLILVGGYIVTMFCAALTMLVTVKMHTPNLAICIPFFLLCMMPFIARVLPAFDAFFNLLPTVLTNIFNAVRTPILFQIGSFVFRQISLLMFLYILLFIVLLPLIYIGYSRYGLKKK